MNDPNKKKNRGQIETGRIEKIPVTIDELEKVTGGANFWFWDDEKRKPHDRNKPANLSDGD